MASASDEDTSAIQPAQTNRSVDTRKRKRNRELQCRPTLIALEQNHETGNDEEAAEHPILAQRNVIGEARIVLRSGEHPGDKSTTVIAARPRNPSSFRKRPGVMKS